MAAAPASISISRRFSRLFDICASLGGQAAFRSGPFYSFPGQRARVAVCRQRRSEDRSRVAAPARRPLALRANAMLEDSSTSSLQSEWRRSTVRQRRERLGAKTSPAGRSSEIRQSPLQAPALLFLYNARKDRYENYPNTHHL